MEESSKQMATRARATVLLGKKEVVREEDENTTKTRPNRTFYRPHSNCPKRIYIGRVVETCIMSYKTKSGSTRQFRSRTKSEPRSNPQGPKQNNGHCSPP